VWSAGWFTLLSSATKNWKPRATSEPGSRTTTATKLAQAVNLSELRKQKLQVQEYVTQLEKQLPGKAEMDALLSDINQAGSGRGLQFELFRPGPGGGQGLLRRTAHRPPRDRAATTTSAPSRPTWPTCRASSPCTTWPSPLSTRTPGTLSMEATARTYRYLDANRDGRGAQGPQAPRPRHQEMKPSPARLTARPARRSAQRWLLLLAGCGAETRNCRSGWSSSAAKSSPAWHPLQAPKKFDPQPYTNAQAVEPFSNQKLTVALKQEARQPNSVLAAEMNRRKEPLESYPLDSMSMVGSVNKGGAPGCPVARRQPAVPGEGG
jgi:type IV pilus assembly protein PilO